MCHVDLLHCSGAMKIAPGQLVHWMQVMMRDYSALVVCLQPGVQVCNEAISLFNADLKKLGKNGLALGKPNSQKVGLWRGQGNLFSK